jgi:hypothetical protein
MSSPPPFSESELRAAVAQATSWADTLRRLGYAVKGANHRTVQRWASAWDVCTDHFDPNIGRRNRSRARAKPLEEAMVKNSTYARGKLKERLFAAGIKRRECEMCGQSEMWNGHRMSLVLDHINGVSNDHRLEKPADRLRQLRRDARDALRAQSAARANVPTLRNRVCAPAYTASVLLDELCRRCER